MASLATKEERDLYKKQVFIRTGSTGLGEIEYFQHPEGEDLLGKLRCSTRWAAIGGGLFGMAKALVTAEKRNYKEWTFLFCKPIIPAVGMAASFTITTYLATNFRKKDDEINYTLGGAAAGLVFGSALRSIPHAILGVICFGIGACYFKCSYPDRTRPFFIPVRTKNFSTYDARVLDFSFTPYKKGNWAKGNPEDHSSSKTVGSC